MASPCLWMWGIVFGEFQCLPVDDCSAVSCDSSALARGSECTSFYSAILNQSPPFFLSLSIVFYFLVMAHSMWDLGSLEDQGSNPSPLHWECGVLTTGLPGNSPQTFLKASLCPRGIRGQRITTMDVGLLAALRVLGNRIGMGAEIT